MNLAGIVFKYSLWQGKKGGNKHTFPPPLHDCWWLEGGATIFFPDTPGPGPYRHTPTSTAFDTFTTTANTTSNTTITSTRKIAEKNSGRRKILAEKYLDPNNHI